MSEYRWSKWYLLGIESFHVNIPDSPGIYEIRTDYEFGRLRGKSPIIYIGSAAKGNGPSLKRRLMNQRIGDPERYLSRAEKLLWKSGHELKFRFVETADSKIAKRLEIQRLTEYEKKYWELPPGNSMLPR